MRILLVQLMTPTVVLDSTMVLTTDVNLRLHCGETSTRHIYDMLNKRRVYPRVPRKMLRRNVLLPL